MKRNSELRAEWMAPAIEAKPAPDFVVRAASLPHMILPLMSLALGLSNLVRLVNWVDGRNVIDPQFTFIVGMMLIVLGVFELRYWWRRLRGE
jgi:hypothetical protein